MGVFIRTDEDTKNMARMDVACCLVASKFLNYINTSQKVMIGDLEWEIRLLEDYFFDTGHRYTVGGDESSVSTPLDSKEEEWWPEREIGGTEEALSVSEEDDMEKGQNSLHKDQNDNIGGRKKECRRVGGNPLSVNLCETDSVVKDSCFSKKESVRSGDGKVSANLCVMEVESVLKDINDNAVWEKEKLRKGKGSILIDLTDIGPNHVFGPIKDGAFNLDTLAISEPGQHVIPLEVHVPNNSNSKSPTLDVTHVNALGLRPCPLGHGKDPTLVVPKAKQRTQNNKKLSMLHKKLQNPFFLPIRQKGGTKLKRKDLKRKVNLDHGALLPLESSDSSRVIESYSGDSNINSIALSVASEEIKSGGNKAMKMWELSKSLGVSFGGEDSVMIKSLEDLEERDRIGFANSNQREHQGNQ